jgi:hypothetical protein
MALRARIDSAELGKPCLLPLVTLLLTDGMPEVVKSFLTYGECSRAARAAGITSYRKFQQWERPVGVPRKPERVYKGCGWTSWGDFLGTNAQTPKRPRHYLSYEESSSLARSEGIKTPAEFLRWRRPRGVPTKPHRFYEGKGWTSWEAFLGVPQRGYHLAAETLLTFDQCVRLVRAARLGSSKEFSRWPRPPGVPARPHERYSEWQGWPHFLGTDRTRPTPPDKILLFPEVKKLARAAGIRTADEYRTWDRPDGVPSNPNVIYRSEWRGWKSFLGTKNFRRERFVTFSECRSLVRAAGIRTEAEFFAWGARPPNVPSSPAKFYRQWRSWGLFLGTSTRTPVTRDTAMRYDELRAAARAAGIRTSADYFAWRRPSNAPAEPHRFYPNWVSWDAFLKG